MAMDIPAVLLTPVPHNNVYVLYSGIMFCIPMPVQQLGRGKRNAEVSSQLMKLYSSSPSYAASHAAGHFIFTA